MRGWKVEGGGWRAEGKMRIGESTVHRPPSTVPKRRRGQARLPRRARRGQAAIEFALATIVAMVLFIGVTRVWAGLIRMMIERQRLFECTRVDAARPEGWAHSHNQPMWKRSDACPRIPLSTGMLPPPPKPLDLWEE